MPRAPEPSLRQQLLEGRARIAEQIDKLRARPYPPIGPGPINTNGVIIDNSALITRLSRLLQDIDDALSELGPKEP
jgi:hypothetical protein